jgi:hypothetical protein
MKGAVFGSIILVKVVTSTDCIGEIPLLCNSKLEVPVRSKGIL